MELDSLLLDTPTDRNLVHGLGDLLVSRLWETVGDDERAWRAVIRKHGQAGLNAYASARLRGQARIAERLGRKNDAIRALRLFIGLRAKAEPPYQREVAQARLTLAKLEKQQSGK